MSGIRKTPDNNFVTQIQMLSSNNSSPAEDFVNLFISSGQPPEDPSFLDNSLNELEELTNPTIEASAFPENKLELTTSSNRLSKLQERKNKRDKSSLFVNSQTGNSTPMNSPAQIEFIHQGSNLFLNEKTPPPPIYSRIPVGTYWVRFHPLKGFFLEIDRNFSESGKVYGKLTQYRDRVLTTYEKKSANTGVILAGTKGSGKTMLARLICEQAVKQGKPVLIVNSPFAGDSWHQFLNNIRQECVILIDEFEKVYDAENQQNLLTLLDGVFVSKKLFLLTCNEKRKVDSHFHNRPGRIHYLINFSGMDLDSIKEYCQENVENPERAKSVIRISSLYSNMSFDVLKALVWEVNNYPESSVQSILEILNARSESVGSDSYEMKVYHPKVGEIKRSSSNLIGFDPLSPKQSFASIELSRDDVFQLIHEEGFKERITECFANHLLAEEDERDSNDLYLKDFLESRGGFSEDKFPRKSTITMTVSFSSKDVRDMNEETSEFMLTLPNHFNLQLRLKRKTLVESHYWDNW